MTKKDGVRENNNTNHGGHKRKITLDYEEYQKLLSRLKELEKAQSVKNQGTDFDHWSGMALKGSENPSPKFKNQDELWMTDKEIQRRRHGD